jgi:hypothetical protein
LCYNRLINKEIFLKKSTKKFVEVKRNKALFLSGGKRQQFSTGKEKQSLLLNAFLSSYTF